MQVGDIIGPYELVEVLGEGGMGTVFLARQDEPIRRQVALKIVRLGLDSAEVLARFELERQTLARMSHDHIARVFDAGLQQGRPYFAMEYVPGLPITEHCDRERLSLAERVALFRQVCAGVQHAHQKGVIHRDLKPSNILVRVQDGAAVPKIIDFGIARAIDQHRIEVTALTEEGRLLGTPEYASPEQIELAGDDIDTRSDVYSAGVVLYELLAGDLPFRPIGHGPDDERAEAGAYEMLRRRLNADPARPSTRLAARGAGAVAIADQRRTSVRALAQELRGELDWVVMKALERDRTHRYGSAHELAEDLGRFLAGEPLLAGPPTARYRLTKLWQRHALLLSAAALVLLSLLAGLLGMIAFAVDAGASARQAQQQARVAAATAEVASARAAEIERQRTAIARTSGALRERTEAFELLSLVVRLDEARAREDALYPSWPEHVAAMQAWLARDVDRLRRNLPRARAAVAALRGQAGASDADVFLRDTLTELLVDVDAFLAARPGAVRERLAWARRIEALSVARFADRWAAARTAIAAADGRAASLRYAHHPIDLRPQMGLVPIGKNPVTGLWEFYHLRSAWGPRSSIDPADVAIPQHDPATGHVSVTAATGIVFVLIPGGTFTMGTQRTDPEGPQFDPLAGSDERLQQIVLAPFFLARHELTQGQWERLSGGETPSRHRPGRDGVTLAHPVEQVAWATCNALTRQYGLLLPTEAQWEYACRAGTTTPWWTGADRDSLVRNGLTANLADQAAARAGARWGDIDDWPELDDGWPWHAPVDTFRANPFGLHHVHGNVWEWCRDWYGSMALPVAPGDGLRLVDQPDLSTERMDRGSSFKDSARSVRSGNRGGSAPSLRLNDLGMRAARAVR
ncbi:MAG: bifunctional serine/threonine-protein kinase/formylglycine-generating enzyme family protein [Planctomycetota bacterium]